MKYILFFLRSHSQLFAAVSRNTVDIAPDSKMRKINLTLLFVKYLSIPEILDYIKLRIFRTTAVMINFITSSH